MSIQKDNCSKYIVTKIWGKITCFSGNGDMTKRVLIYIYICIYIYQKITQVFMYSDHLLYNLYSCGFRIVEGLLE